MTLPAIDWASAGLRGLVVVVALGIWHWTQTLIGRRPPVGEGVGGGLGDRLHDWTLTWHVWFRTHPRAFERTLILSSLLIDVFGLSLIACALFGPSFAPFLSVLIVFSMRQVCQGLCQLPPPPGSLWRNPGFPSLLVTYHVSTDMFFSGHTALAVLGAIEAVHAAPGWLAAIAILIALGQMLFMIVLRGHYTLDIIAGVFAAFVGRDLAVRIAPWIDTWLG